MILIADSGSTKCDWAICGDCDATVRIASGGLNPFACNDRKISETLDSELMPHIGDSAEVGAVYFYGAGCIFEGAGRIEQALRSRFAHARVEVAGDMLGAARALCGSGSGIVCILGTGSNSCLYDGRQITANVPPLGYILGDEGGGAHIGRLVVADILKGLTSESLRTALFEECRTSYAEIIECVYRQPQANRYLAGFAEFAARHLDEPEIAACVDRAFDAFIERNVMQYDTAANRVGFVGSIAHFFRKRLLCAVERHGLRAGRIMRSPIEALVEYHNIMQRTTVRM